ncbi:MAG: hypothetical protein OP8BY_1585 [Candidatus Saccharicenans subterraneus]|uniref:Uncharacterized protein n=1 Tax=Candidatus Saccharicenans subterraneus TaxID=2508984 RepID=A0A3E2BP36_9BACT|nr:MAG: hypothetical protein OP8BY_1585 [Candidatus Saccharicenans subterraneum]
MGRARLKNWQLSSHAQINCHLCQDGSFIKTSPGKSDKLI